MLSLKSCRLMINTNKGFTALAAVEGLPRSFTMEVTIGIITASFECMSMLNPAILERIIKDQA